MIGALIPVIGTVIDKIFPDKEAAAKAKLELFRMEQTGELKELESKSKIIEAEAKSEHWLTSTWRPMIMLMFGFIVFNNYILAPYIDLFFDKNLMLVMPDQLWDLLQIGLGGYLVGRSAEKVVKEYRR